MSEQPDLLDLGPRPERIEAPAPCPFCGEVRAIARWSDWRVSCGGCGALGPTGHPIQLAIERWNARPPPKPQAPDEPADLFTST